jgi:uncharacterized protein (TIGR03083 family)
MYGRCMTHHTHRLDDARYLASLEADGLELARFAERDLDAMVPGCPGWTVEDLVWHMGSVHHRWGTIARDRVQDPQTLDRPHRPPRNELLAWYRDTLARAVDALRSADPTTPVWTWTSERNVGWIRRRMAHETAIHAWDAASATTTPSPIEVGLAVDGIDEFFESFTTETADASDVSVHLHASDAAGEWLVVIEEGKLRMSHEHAKADAALRGTASNLLLLLWGRIPEAEVEVHGDRAALFKLLEVADLA